MSLYPLSTGDETIIFLYPPGSSYILGGGYKFEPMLSGVCQVFLGRVGRFGEGGGSVPGRIMADITSKSPTVAEFFAQLDAVIKNNRAMVQRITTAEKDKDAAWLLELYLSPIPKTIWQRQCIELAGKHLANWHDLALLDKAMPQRLIPELTWGFGTPAGRDYLLKQISDESLPAQKRLDYIKALPGAGAVYGSTYTAREKLYECQRKPLFSVSDTNQPDNAGYLTRIAQLARQQKNPELQAALLESLRILAMKDINKDLPIVQADLVAVNELWPDHLVPLSK